MDAKLLLQALGKYVCGAALTALLVFLPAGTLRFWNGQLLMAVLFLPMLLLGCVMFVKAPALLRRRLNAKENEAEQKSVVAWSGLLFVAAFVIAGLGYRFGWPMLPRLVCLVFAGVFLLGYAFYAEVLRENEYLSRTVEVQAGQRVVDTGLYGVVRHPMYLATLLLFLSMPLILGSVFAFAVMLGYLPIIAARIRGEEALLERELAGYREYKQKVRYRLIPGIW
ncbi:MAG: isoprenylcysteine carboxylmethyltransferase family protein [Oscillospiraceae bacterium]|nr:isoprenylcysteine carboxylmethyltransferase family protein [Oscillospiraceae bacterium]